MNTDRAIKLLTKLGAIDEKLGNLTRERDEVTAELTSIIGSQSSTTTAASKGAKTGTKPSTGTEGGLGPTKILPVLLSSPGLDLAGIAQKVGEKAQPIALALSHLVKKGLAYSDKGLYYPAVPVNLGAAAKATSTPPMGSYVTPDDEETETV